MEDLRRAFPVKFPDAATQFDDCDVQRLMENDVLVGKFLEANDQDVEKALVQVEKSFRFRREMSLNTISESSFPLELRQKGSVYYRNVDLKGNKILYFRIRDARRDPAVAAVVKQFVAFLIDQEHRRDPGQQLVMLFDMSGAGVTNFDSDLVRFIITCFDTHFPRFLAYLLVFDMPFILNAAWKLIRNWLSERAREKVLFVKRSSVVEYIAPDQLPLHMGGTDDFQFEYHVPEGETIPVADSKEQQTSSNGVPAGGEVRRRGSAPATSPGHRSGSSRSVEPLPALSSPAAVTAGGGGGDAPVLAVSPGEQLHFPAPGDSTTLQLSSSQAQPVAFKVNTTSPETFRVRPSAGLLPPRARADVEVTWRAGAAPPGPGARFQVLALPVAAEVAPAEALASLRAAPREALFELRLSCATGPKEAPKAKEAPAAGLAGLAGRLEAQQRALGERLEALEGLVRILCALAAALLAVEVLRLGLTLGAGR